MSSERSSSSTPCQSTLPGALPGGCSDGLRLPPMRTLTARGGSSSSTMQKPCECRGFSRDLRIPAWPRGGWGKRSECDVVAVGRRPARSSSLLAQSSSLGRSSLGRSSLGCRVARSSRRSVVTSLLARSLCRSVVASVGLRARRVARSSRRSVVVGRLVARSVVARLSSRRSVVASLGRHVARSSCRSVVASVGLVVASLARSSRSVGRLVARSSSLGRRRSFVVARSVVARSVVARSP